MCNRTHTHARALLLFQGLLVSSMFVFNVPPTAKAILRHSNSFGPHPIGWPEEPGIELGISGYKESG